MLFVGRESSDMTVGKDRQIWGCAVSGKQGCGTSVKQSREQWRFDSVPSPLAFFNPRGISAPFFHLKINTKMSEYFESKVKFLRQMDNGLIKAITETYLVDCMSFTECEARVRQEVGEGMREVTMMSEKRSNIKEVVLYGDTDLFFKVKVQYALMDEDTEKEKKVTTHLLVNANDAREAYDRTAEHLKEMIVPFQISKIEESPIIEVYQYKKQAPAGFKKVVYEADGKEPSSALYPDPTLGQAVHFEVEDESEEECAMDAMEVDIEATNIIGALSKEDRDWLFQTSTDYVGRRYSMAVERFGWSDDLSNRVFDHIDKMDSFDQDEEDGHTDLEGRLEAAFGRAGAKPMRIVGTIDDEGGSGSFGDLLDRQEEESALAAMD